MPLLQKILQTKSVYHQKELILAVRIFVKSLIHLKFP